MMFKCTDIYCIEFILTLLKFLEDFTVNVIKSAFQEQISGKLAKQINSTDLRHDNLGAEENIKSHNTGFQIIHKMKSGM